MLALRGSLLTPSGHDLLYLPDGVLLADASGRIVFVGSPRDARRHFRGPVQDVRPHLIVPGFVDAHVHYPQTRIIGRATGPLLEWLQRAVFPEEARFRKPSYAHAVADEMCDRLIAVGTTTAGLFSSSSPRATDLLLARLEQRGLRAMVGLVLMDKNCPEALRVAREPALRACRRLARHWHGRDGDRLRVAVTPRFALSCSRALLEGAGRLARELDLPVQTHIAETLPEGEATKRAHPYARDYLDVYQRAGLVGPRTVLAHAIHLSRDEWRRVHDSGAALAHCPDSNFFLGSGRMRVAQAVTLGIRVGLGSDVAAGRSFSMRRAMAHAYDNAMCLRTPLEPAAIFRMATLGGAEALGWQQRIGSLEAGKDADLCVVPLPRPLGQLDAVLAHLLFDSDALEVKMSFVRGRRLLPRLEGTTSAA